MTYNEYSKKYSHWIDLRVQANRSHVNQSVKKSTDTLRQLTGYLDNPILVRAVPRILHETHGHLYGEELKRTPKNITASFDNLKNRIAKNVDYAVKRGDMTRTEGNKILGISYARIEREKSTYLNPIQKLDKRAQEIYKKSIIALNRFAATGRYPKIEKVVEGKYLPSSSANRMSRPSTETVVSRSRPAVLPTRRINGRTYQLQSPKRGTTNGRVVKIKAQLRQQQFRSVRVVKDGSGRKFVYATRR